MIYNVCILHHPLSCGNLSPITPSVSICNQWYIHFIITIHNVHILHSQDCDHALYLHYTSLKHGLKMEMLHSHSPIIWIFLDAQHHTSIHVQNLHHSTWYFCKFTNPVAIIINSLSFPSTYITQGSVPPSLHHNPSYCTTSFYGSIIYWTRCGSRTLATKMESCTLIYKYTFKFLKKI